MVVQNEITLPTVNGHTVPNYPNFYLGPLVGSGCDTLPSVGISPPAPFSSAQSAVKVYPNPARDRLLVEMPYGSPLPWQRATFGLMDLQGKDMIHQSLTEEKTTIPVAHLPEGVYIYRIKTDKEAYYGKVVIQR